MGHDNGGLRDFRMEMLGYRSRGDQAVIFTRRWQPISAENELFPEGLRRRGGRSDRQQFAKVARASTTTTPDTSGIFPEAAKCHLWCYRAG